MGIIDKGKYIEVHPTFLYESLITFLLFIVLSLISNKRKYQGQTALTYLICYSFARMIIEGLRSDSLMLGGIKISQLLSMVLLIISITIMIIKKYKIYKASQTNK